MDVAAALAEVVAALPGGGEPRPGQVRMAEAVTDAIDRAGHLVVQAGTGTGKSLGYLVPAVLAGRRTVVATATKALQDQLVGRDLPFLAGQIGLPFTFASLKGRSNYLCLQRAREVLEAEAGEQRLEGIDDDTTRAEVLALVEWGTTATDGDRASLAFEPSPRAWSAVSVSADECPGAARCPVGEACFAERARSAAAAADVVVVNTHLYGVHLAAGRGVLPPHDVVVFDEAHQLEDIVSATAGIELGEGRFTALARTARGVLAERDVPDAIEGAALQLAAALAPHHGRRVGPADVATALGAARGRLERLGEALRRVDTKDADAQTRKARAQKALLGLLDDIDRVLELPDGDVAWVEGAQHAPVLKVAPIDVAACLVPLWDGQVADADDEAGDASDASDDVEDVEDDDGDDGDDGGSGGGGAALALGPRRRRFTAVLTSATLPPGIAERLGLPGARTEVLDVGSPFDHATHGLLYCAAHLPDPRSPARDAAVADELVALLQAAGGRTLALFTSYRAMQAAVEAVRPRVDTPVLVQGDLPKPALVDAFAADEATSLFATMGFWQGIDVPGRTLSVVAIDRLPFPRPDDPLLEARRTQAGRRQAFAAVDLPRAITLLAQGAGRLLRTGTDRGVVAVLDPRLATAGYRWDIVNALPPFGRTRHRADVETFLAESDASAAAPPPAPPAEPA